MSAARHEVCAVALAELFRGDGEILASPIGVLPTIGARLAKLTFEPELLLTDGVCRLLGTVPALGREADAVIEGYMPYRSVFDVVWSGRRHVIMGASQIDRFGNQNIACIGDPKKPKAHGPRVFVEKVDVVSGVGYDRARKLEPASARFHSIRGVVTNLAVLDFETPDRAMRLVSVHPGVSVDDVKAQTGFELVVPENVPETRAPSAEELRLIREVIDPEGRGKKEIAA
jgi:acyl CoA:acetate/3-ketoacid CoA transferase beta subunit